MELHNETHCVDCGLRGLDLSQPRQSGAFCLELTYSALQMPTEPLQIGDSVVVLSQAIADHPQVMYLGVNPMATATCVNLAAGWCMVRFQNLSHQWIQNRLFGRRLEVSGAIAWECCLGLVPLNCFVIYSHAGRHF